MTVSRTITSTAPAKINVGLEILGRREDGYHEIRTVMAMIDLVDTLTISAGGPGESRIEGVPGVRNDDNLISRAIAAFSEKTGLSRGYRVVVQKRIPSPGGLGGASSDAAATLIALNELNESPFTVEELSRIGATLGADVPFFLGSSAAIASGTGTTLATLPPMDGWVVLIVPALRIENKTPTLYRALREDDFSDGSRVNRIAGTICRGEMADASDLVNAFERPLYRLAPELLELRDTVLAAGAPFVALSGAGPAHYVIFKSKAEASALASRLEHTLPGSVVVHVARFLPERPAAIQVRE